VASEAEDPTYMAVDDLELLLEQNMLVARHRGHSMPVKMRAYSLDPCVPMKWESGKTRKLYLHGRPIRIWRRSWLILQINIIDKALMVSSPTFAINEISVGKYIILSYHVRYETGNKHKNE
jgi:hypothetical protein